MRFALLALIAAIAASPALAETVAGTATLAAPAAQTKIVGEGGVWRCSGTTCTGPADTRARLAVAACSAVADANGRVVAFSAGGTEFAAAELARCNRHVKS
ncbi:CC_3452 family protein [Glacieibacterium frigidum]|uniref:CC_3452 family protein n=1 Tax=Glacieibacterium frigidum TaxID=2593303 RepID=UPI00163D41DD|nr:hypothetical protein [Glacieibacterium frigidum]